MTQQATFQSYKIWNNINWIFKLSIIYFFIISIIQEFSKNQGAVKVFGVEMSQFYTGTSIRLSPYIFLAFIFVPIIKKFLNLKGFYYFNEMLFNGLLLVDTFTHVNSNMGYNKNLNLLFFGEAGMDKLTHFLKGLVIGTISTHFLYKYFSINEKERFQNDWRWVFFVGIGFFSFFYTVWEIFELYTDLYLGTNLIATQYDTNKDLLANTLGYLLGFGLVYIVIKIYQKLIIDKSKTPILDISRQSEELQTQELQV